MHILNDKLKDWYLCKKWNGRMKIWRSFHVEHFKKSIVPVYATWLETLKTLLGTHENILNALWQIFPSKITQNHILGDHYRSETNLLLPCFLWSLQYTSTLDNSSLNWVGGNKNAGHDDKAFSTWNFFILKRDEGSRSVCSEVFGFPSF